MNYVETTDGRYRRVLANLWWDTTDGVDLYDDEHVVRHMDEHPGVGLMVINEQH